MAFRGIRDDDALRFALGDALEVVSGQLERAIQLWLEETMYASRAEAVFHIWWTALTVTGSDYARQLYFVRSETLAINGRRYLVDFSLIRKGRALGDPDTSLKMAVFVRPVLAADDAFAHGRREQEVAALRGAGWAVYEFSDTDVIDRPYDCAHEVMDDGELAIINADERKP